MNVPVNFEKISNKSFREKDIDFMIDIDYTKKGDVWIMSNEKYPLCFDIDWAKETYTLIKCTPGMSRSGTILLKNSPLFKHYAETADLFITFLKGIVNKLISDGRL